MFTVKFYTEDANGHGFRQLILAAESFTLLRGGEDGGAEITLHQKNQGDDRRIDIGSADEKRDPNWPPLYQRAIIENATGKTTEIINCIRPMAA
jgi:hypothetical protein